MSVHTVKHTLVQHSGYGYGRKPGFENAVEVRSLHTKADQADVRKAGGLLFDTIEEAYAAEDAENYPRPNMGMYPHVEGTFAGVKIDGLAVYVAPYRPPVARVIEEQGSNA